jgi:hypothetical protein
VGTFGFDGPGVDGVDADFAGPEFFGERAGDGVDRAFGAGVNRGVRRRDTADDGADVDDTGAFGEVFSGRLSRQEKTQDVDVKELMELGLSDGFDGCEFVDSGIVDQDVEAAVVFDGGVDDAFGPSAALETSPPTATALPPAAVMAETTVSAPALLEA